MICKVLLGCLICYLPIGFLFAWVIVATWRIKEPPEVAGFILYWPYSLVLIVAGAVASRFKDICERMQHHAVRDRKSTKSLADKLRIR